MGGTWRFIITTPFQLASPGEGRVALSCGLRSLRPQGSLMAIGGSRGQCSRDKMFLGALEGTQTRPGWSYDSSKPVFMLMA